MLQVALERDGFEVVAVAGLVDALSRVAEEKIDPLLSDDMRHTHPQASNAGAQWLPAPEEPGLFLCEQRAEVSRVMTAAGHRV
jgi:hypothetical protein